MGKHVQKQQQDLHLWESPGRQGWFQGRSCPVEMAALSENKIEIVFSRC